MFLFKMLQTDRGYVLNMCSSDISIRRTHWETSSQTKDDYGIKD